MWTQNYNPAGSVVVSTVVAAVPVVVFLGSIVALRMRIHRAALLALGVVLAVAVGVWRVPVDIAAASALYGGAFGLFPIGWLVLNVIFVYRLTVERGHFEILRGSLAGIAPDPRIQVIFIAFGFGAFLEGMAGFGAPVAITAVILIQLGFKPLHASGLSLIANTAPVAFGGLGIPILTLEQVTGLDARTVSAMVGRQLPFFSLILPFWVVVAFAGWRGMRGIWPAALVAGLGFAVPQFLVSNYHGPWLVDIVSGVASILATMALLRVWKPKVAWRFDGAGNAGPDLEERAGAASPEAATMKPTAEQKGKEVFQAWLPWLILTVFIFLWGMPRIAGALDRVYAVKIPMPYLHLMVHRAPPIAPSSAEAESALFTFNPLSTTGSAILLAAVIAGAGMGFSFGAMARVYGKTLWDIRYSLSTITMMLAVGNVMKYAGLDATLGLALARTGSLYPFFGTLLGWLGVALTGSDTASNVMFGSLQKITATQLGISPVLMGAANSSGGVMGKMMAAQSIVIASTATNWYGHEGKILRYVFWHSVALAGLMGGLVYLQAYVAPFIYMVPR